jgi:hypothetical protein
LDLAKGDAYIALVGEFGDFLSKAVEVDLPIPNEEVLIVAAPEEPALALLDHAIGVEVDDAIAIVVFEADQLRQVRVGDNHGQLLLKREVELDWDCFGGGEVEERDVVAVE